MLVNSLKSITPMYNLYRVLKDRDEPPTSGEITMASGKKALDGRTEAEHLKLLEMSKENIKKAFEDQKARAVVSIKFVGLHSERISFFSLKRRISFPSACFRTPKEVRRITWRRCISARMGPLHLTSNGIT